VIKLHNRSDHSPTVTAADLIRSLGFGDALDYAHRRGQRPDVRSRSRAYWQRVANEIAALWSAYQATHRVGRFSPPSA
jgi:hypothetical protein